MRAFLCIPLALLCLCVPAAAPADASANYVLGPINAKPGTTAYAYLDVAPGVDPGTRIPVSVIHGTRSGPTLALIAGTHGYEYPPITALQRLRKELSREKA